MKISSLFYLSILGVVLGSCSCSDQKYAQYPSNPIDGQRYVDPQGNSSIWNAALGCWMISSMMNGQQVVHRYYPSSGIYYDSYNRPVERPSYIPSSSKNKDKESYFFGSSSNNTKSSSGFSSSKTTKSTKSASFGSIGKSHSIGS